MLTDTTAVEVLLDEYRQGPVRLRLLVSTLSSSQLTSKPIPGKWTPIELLCHLADSESLFAERMKRVLIEEEPHFYFADPSVCPSALKYLHRIADIELMCVEASRLQMSVILTALDPNSWQRTGVHPKEGVQTLEQLVKKAVGHFEHHYRELETKILALKQSD